MRQFDRNREESPVSSTFDFTGSMMHSMYRNEKCELNETKKGKTICITRQISDLFVENFKLVFTSWLYSGCKLVLKAIFMCIFNLCHYNTSLILSFDFIHKEIYCNQIISKNKIFIIKFLLT